MKKVFLLFSHQLTPKQKEELINNFNVNEFINLPQELQEVWSNIPSESAHIKNYLNDLFKWLLKKAKVEDLVLVQGEIGAVYLLVDFCKKNGYIPIYATTKREVSEEALSAEAIQLNRIFTHVRFRTFEDWVD